MLINPRQELIEARKNKYAIGAFNTSDLEITQAILVAADKEKVPIIVQISPKAIEYAGLDNLVDIVRNEAQKHNVSVALHLDHGKSIETVKDCLKAGFTSVMFDGSDLAFAENVQASREVVTLAKPYNACVEAELGSIGGKEDFVQGKICKTDPNKAQEFVKMTGVDTLAVSIGNVHGIPSDDEKLDFDLLKQIAAQVSVPLVLHGASSTPKEDIKKVIDLGIAKVNIDTDIRMAFSGNLRAFQQTHPDVYDPREILDSAKKAVEKVVQEKIRLFNNRAK